MLLISSSFFLLIFVLRSDSRHVHRPDDLDCHCYTERCYQSFIPCPEGCDPGYEGPFCSLQNLAYGQPATQSGVYTDTDCDPDNGLNNQYCGQHEAKLAVDGDDSTYYWHGSCSVTNTFNRTAWWKVYLGQVYNISNLLIYLPNQEKRRPDYVEVIIGDTLCYNFTRDELSDVILNVTCQHRITGSTVLLKTSVQSKTTNPSLTLCEVKIPRCNDFWFGDQCQHQCHCLDKTEVCDKVTGDCASGCAHGRIGKGCQLNNLVLGEKASQSSTWSDVSNCTGSPPTFCGERIASLAVDGNRDQNFQHGSCSRTATGQNVAYWTVWLYDIHTVNRLRIYFPEHEIYSTAGIEIYVDNALCYSSSMSLPNVADITCQEPLQGDSVSFNLPLMNISGELHDRVLTLCEVEIYDCDKYKFGKNCEEVCHCQDAYEVCDTVTGHCPQSGCKSGWTGPDCQTLCPPYTYGMNCSSQCGRCADNASCDPITGTCPALCAPGFVWQFCDECEYGFWGENCDKPCPVCPQHGSCFRYNGSCTTSCTAHAKGPDCNECQTGWFGPKCQYDCGNCKGDDICDNITGQCPNGCETGWQGHLCKEECPDGRFGDECADHCGRCIDPVPCDKLTGYCLGECEEGWAGKRCDICDQERYSVNCSKTCGHCLDSDTCDNVTGECPRDCMPGWTGVDCKTALITHPVATTQPTTAPPAATTTTTPQPPPATTPSPPPSSTPISAGTTKVPKHHVTHSHTRSRGIALRGISPGVLAAIVVSCVVILCGALVLFILIWNKTRRKSYGGVKYPVDLTYTELPKIANHH